MTNLTQNEITAMKLCLNYGDRQAQHDDNFSNAGPLDIAKALGWDMQQVGGLLSNLRTKGMAYVDDRSEDVGLRNCGVDMHIVWLLEAGIDAIFDIIEGEAA